MLLSTMFAWSAIVAKPVLAADADHLAFDIQPSGSYTADDPIAVTVGVKDAGGAAVTDAANPITLTAVGASIDPLDTTVKNASGGSASFTVHVRAVGTGYSLKATSAGLGDGTSTPFAITPGALTHTDLSPLTSMITADTETQTYVATGKDAYGNSKGVVTTQVTFGIDGGASCTGASCGSRTKGAYNVHDSKTGTAALTITAGALDHFTVTTAPTSPATDYVAGASFDVTVTAYDHWGNVKDDYTGGATLSGLAGSPGCADCSPVASQGATYGSIGAGSFSNGVATTTATGYLAAGDQKITATGGGKTGTSSGFTILPAALHHFTWDSLGSNQKTAGGSFDITATAYDTYGNVKTDYDPSSAALTSTLVDSPNGTEPSVPDNLSWTDGVGTARVYAVKATAFGTPDYATTESFKIKDGSVEQTSGAFGVKPNNLNNISFAATDQADPTFGGGQPLDTKVSSIIYSACNRNPAAVGNPTADPCLSTSAPVKVLARDGFGNRKPGVEVTISTTPAVDPSTSFVGTKTGTTGDGTSGTTLGEATFSSLKITKISGTQTDAYRLVATAGSLDPLESKTFRIVSDLAQCTGQSRCFNNTRNNSVATPENSYSQTKAKTGNFGNVVATTNFANPTDVNAQCATVRTGPTIGSAIDVRVAGDNLNVQQPTTTMVMIIPIKTLKFYGLTARNADSYNVCLGALFIDGVNTGTKASADSKTPWIGRDKKGKALPANRAADADGLWRFWGVPTACGDKIITTADPCISLKSKSASAVAAQLHTVTGETWTASRVNSELNMFDGDIAIFINKPWPWDSKGGSY